MHGWARSVILSERWSVATSADDAWRTSPAAGNYTPDTQLIFRGFSNDPDLQKLLSGGLLLIYVMTVVGNLGMMALILMDSCLYGGSQ